MLNDLWKTTAIQKKEDGTFIIQAHTNTSILPYHVCSKHVDPTNLFNVEVVSGFWNSLPDNDPRKQVYQVPEPEPDTRLPEEKREATYVAEADPLFDKYQFYLAEAEGWELLDNEEEAESTRGKAHDYLIAYLQKKQKIRERYPDDETA